MLLVGGGIYVHNSPFIHPIIFGELLVGLIIGLIVVIPVTIYHKIRSN